MNVLRIIGIDPGSRITGFGIVDFANQRMERIASGCIRIGDLLMPDRLLHIHDQLKHAIALYQPQQAAIESVFVKTNPLAALKLGQARGAAMLAAAASGLPLHEYSPNTVKLAVVGRGHANKAQINHMVRAILRLPQALQEDEADALAVAICDGHTTLSAYSKHTGNAATQALP